MFLLDGPSEPEFLARARTRATTGAIESDELDGEEYLSDLRLSTFYWQILKTLRFRVFAQVARKRVLFRKIIESKTH